MGVAVSVLGLAGVALFFLHMRSNVVDASLPAAAAAFAATSTQFSVGGATSSVAASPSAPRQAPAGFKEYRNVRYTFSLFYPGSLSVKEIDEGAGARTITFQNPSQGLGFQIFIVPYREAQVTDAQFKKDEPSGVHTNVQNGLVAGATAAAFDGSDAVLGDTREVWFIHNGFLYEVTTMKSLDGWLSQILSTWQFI